MSFSVMVKPVLFLLINLAFTELFTEKCFAFPDFKTRIPNGDNVPHPCLVNIKWKAAGHENALGGGDRNPFGRDFKEHGLVRFYNKFCCISKIITQYH